MPKLTFFSYITSHSILFLSVPFHQHPASVPISHHMHFYRNSCPISALKDYLASRDASFPDSKFLFLTSRGMRPSRSWFLKRFHEFFSHNKSGHSLRSGGATALGQAGLPMDFIQLAGRWSSEAFRIYVRDHPVLTLGARRARPLAEARHAGAFVDF